MYKYAQVCNIDFILIKKDQQKYAQVCNIDFILIKKDQ